MQSLEPPDLHHLSAAMGWFELGNREEALVELRKIHPTLQTHADVLEIRWIIHAAGGDWSEALVAAQGLLRSAPDRYTGWLHQAYALRRVPGAGLPAAWDALLPAVEKFPKEYAIAYNLSCYACQMSRLDEARIWLQRAMKVGDKSKVKSMALNDPDLKALWPEIQKA